ncbi:alpha/beta hydrolase [Rhizorhabdus wittichii]|uniref:Alpha/beta hydrolase n=1 Tax=Rhizorhabdus wittichii TaxID=160791 RepID=A0A975D609_9SPHN|nr:alpha/beta hydrolase [Rhizorhabdus wittichii]QTH23424.1 alpha/beta hydrolase [Rhizorhabdus wittichii]
MSLADMPAQPNLVTSEGGLYAARVLKASKRVLATADAAKLDIPYGSDYWQKIDIFLPEAGTAAARPLPIFAFAHGGSWIGGYKEWMAFMAPAICALPAIFVSVSYRLAPDHKFPEPLTDCADALALIHKLAPDLGGDPTRIFVGGHSAGGHLMVLLSLHPQLLEERGLDERSIRRCIIQSAPFDIRDDPDEQTAITRIQETLLRNPSDAAAASPLAYDLRNAPPFSIFVGEHDFPRILRGSARMRVALQKAGIPTHYVEQKGQDHFETNSRCTEPDSAWLDHVSKMICSY